MITDEMMKTIEEKGLLILKLNKKIDEKTNIELNLKKETIEILNKAEWKTIYPNESRITDKLKTAYVDKKLEIKNTQLKWLENDISKIKREIEICNDRISLCKYIIRELEITKK